MQYVVIDPYTLIFDATNNSESKMQRYIDLILDTGDIEDYPYLVGLISNNTIELLMEHNNYPDWEKLNAELKKFDLSKKYQAQDIIRVLEGILRFETVEEHTKIKEILFSISYENANVISDTTELYLRELERLYIYCYLIKKKDGEIFLKSSNSNEIEVASEILDVEAFGELELDIPFSFKEKLKTIETLEEILFNINCIELWKETTSEEQIRDIINLYLIQERCYIKKNTWEIGNYFIENFRKFGFSHESTKIKMLLRSILEVICETNLAKGHALREDKSGGASQIESHLGKAWRYDIDREYHLHYWKKGNLITLASIGPHNAFSIPF
ncbi:hypothetical protein MKY07_16035 [Solibacillus sp. FSL W7-1472]|uniref:hypothetical protein n=1 Tax=Solibacillus sp. FSL W7-1472 TaxID=2921707 RepID=UPI0030D9FA5F